MSNLYKKWTWNKKKKSSYRTKQSTPSLPLLPGPFWPGVVAPDMVQSMGHVKLFDI